MIRTILYLMVAFLVPASNLVWAQTWQVRPCSAYGANCRDVIPDKHGTSAGAMTSTITIPAAQGTAVAPQVIAGVRARIKLTHTRLQDVSMSLTGPDGATFNLQSGAGTRQDIDAVYGGLVSNPVSQFDRTPGVAGEYRILTFVSYHDRPAVTGDWTLTVNDNAHLNYGALDGWSLEFYTSEKFVTISATIPDATEGPLVPGQFMVTRAVVTTEPLTVNLSFGGTARNGEDYQPLLYTVIIPAYEASQTIWVTPILHQALLGTRTVIASVLPGAGYVAGGGGGSTTATVIITDGPVKVSASAQGIPLLGPLEMVLLALLLGATGVVAVNLRRRNPFGPGGSAQ